MSGHSKWAQIKRQKGANDQKRGQTFTKLATAIAVAAKEKGGDPESNFGLRLAIDKAKAANMPKENIERAIKRGTGELADAQIDELLYEAYGPEGVALLISIQTDNKNRALSEVKLALSRHSGKLATGGAVRYLFQPIGQLILTKTDFDRQFEVALEAGAEDVDEAESQIIVQTASTDLQSVREQLLQAGFLIEEVGLTWRPTIETHLTDSAFEQLDRLESALLELDDVVSVIDNAEANQNERT